MELAIGRRRGTAEAVDIGVSGRDSERRHRAVAFQIPKGEWHNTVSLESGTVIIEFKNGPYKG